MWVHDHLWLRQRIWIVNTLEFCSQTVRSCIRCFQCKPQLKLWELKLWKLLKFAILPPRPPHIGALLEEGGMSAKQLLLQAVGRAMLIKEELQTVLVGVHAVLNSRPKRRRRANSWVSRVRNRLLRSCSFLQLLQLLLWGTESRGACSPISQWLVISFTARLQSSLLRAMLDHAQGFAGLEITPIFKGCQVEKLSAFEPASC